MKGIHVNWTKPFFHRHRLRGHGFEITRNLSTKYYDQPDHQIFYTLLSIAYWKAKNGPIKLYTDTIGLAFYQQFKIPELYDEVNISFLNGYSKTNIDPAYFWTSGKIKVLANQSEPFVFLDQDMIIKSKLPQDIINKDLTITHWEIPGGYYYFTKKQWEEEITHIPYIDGLTTNDWTPNTSFLCFNNMDIVREYTNWHTKLVKDNKQTPPEWFWLFTDQGILGHVLRQNTYNVGTLTDRIFYGNSNYGHTETRNQGISEPWYKLTDADISKDTLSWEHVWLRKVDYSYDKKLLEDDTQRFFNECVKLGLARYLEYARFKKYWDVFNKDN